MKKIIITGFLFVYFCLAFILWEWNPSEWSTASRFVFIGCLIGVLAIAYPINEIIKLTKQN